MTGSLTKRLLGGAAFALTAIAAGATGFALTWPDTGRTIETMVVKAVMPTIENGGYRFDLTAMDFMPVALLPASEPEAMLAHADAGPMDPHALYQPLVLRSANVDEVVGKCPDGLLRLVEVETGAGRYGLILAPEDRPSAISTDAVVHLSADVARPLPAEIVPGYYCRHSAV